MASCSGRVGFRCGRFDGEEMPERASDLSLVTTRPIDPLLSHLWSSIGERWAERRLADAIVAVDSLSRLDEKGMSRSVHFGLARRVRPSLPERSPWGTVLWVRWIREPVFALRVIVKLVTRIFLYTEYPFRDPAKRGGRSTELYWILIYALKTGV